MSSRRLSACGLVIRVVDCQPLQATQSHLTYLGLASLLHHKVVASHLGVSAGTAFG